MSRVPVYRQNRPPDERVAAIREIVETPGYSTRLYDIPEAAEILGCSLDHLYKMVQRGEIHTFDTDPILFTADTIVALLARPFRPAVKQQLDLAVKGADGRYHIAHVRPVNIGLDRHGLGRTKKDERPPEPYEEGLAAGDYAEVAPVKGFEK